MASNIDYIILQAKQDIALAYDKFNTEFDTNYTKDDKHLIEIFNKYFYNYNPFTDSDMYITKKSNEEVIDAYNKIYPYYDIVIRNRENAIQILSSSYKALCEHIKKTNGIELTKILLNIDYSNESIYIDIDELIYSYKLQYDKLDEILIKIRLLFTRYHQIVL